jgi:hypothetical protein
MEIISQMVIDEEDVYATGIIDRYSVRPNSVEDMCNIVSKSYGSAIQDVSLLHACEI